MLLSFEKLDTDSLFEKSTLKIIQMISIIKSLNLTFCPIQDDSIQKLIWSVS